MPTNDKAYSYLGPAGTFTEAALKSSSIAKDGEPIGVNNIHEGFMKLNFGKVAAAMFAIENTVEGGVAAVLDLLANNPGLRIIEEVLVPVQFSLVIKPGVNASKIKTISAHPVAYAQCTSWLAATFPDHMHLPAASNIQAADVLTGNPEITADAAIVPVNAATNLPFEVLAENIGDNPNAVTRFVLVSKAGTFSLPTSTGHDKTSLVADLPENKPGALLELLEQFATRGVNLSLIHSRPVGDGLGSYRFIIDLKGHVDDEAVADALLGLKRFSPRVLFLGSYPSSAARGNTEVANRNSSEDYEAARSWLRLIKTEIS